MWFLVCFVWLSMLVVWWSYLVCRWSTIFVSGAAVPYVRINYGEYSNGIRASVACAVPSWLPCSTACTSENNLNKTGYCWRLLRDDRNRLYPCLYIESYNCYRHCCLNFYL